jgi:autotransporter-associated beta strand protein
MECQFQTANKIQPKSKLMKTLTRLLICTGLAAGLTAQVASAVTLTNTVRNVKGMGVKIVYAGPTYSRSYDKPGIRCGDRTTELNKLWIGWDLSAAWVFYGKANLVDASFTYWGENGTSRNFWVAALDNSVELDGWGQDTIEWTSAPANILYTSDPGTANLRCAFDYTKCYLGTNIWQGGAGSIAVNLANPNFGTMLDQAARYTTTNSIVNSNLTAWLKTDTDGLVTLMASGIDNQNWWVGTNGSYTNDITLGYVSAQPGSLGEVCRDSPTLTLVFDVRVALGGGGTACPGGLGTAVYLGGTDVGYDYLLYTNDVYTGQKVAGTGSSVSFGLQNVAGTYTAVESNITTSVTRLIPGAPVISYYSAPGITVQPNSLNAAINSVAFFSVTATNAGGGLSYQWYRNGAPLTDDGRITGATTKELLINPVQAGDAATTANGYYCVVANLCGDITTSTTNALTLQAARNLVWLGTPTNSWDIGTTVNWSNTASGTLSAFNQGDNVTLDGNAVSTGVIKSSPYLSPGTITFNASGAMGIGGLGNIFGLNSSLVVNGPTSLSQLVISNANSFSGGTTINDGWLTLNNISAVGSGTITMAGTGFSLLETVATGGANSGYPGINVLADSKIQVDGNAAYAGSFVGPITGTAGKKLTLHKPSGVAADNIRFWHTNFTCDVDIDLNIGSANFATYNDIGVQTYNGVISGVGVLFTRQGGRIILTGANTFTGGTRLSAGTTGIGIDSVGVDFGVTSGALGTGSVTIEGNIGLFANGGAHTVGNPVVYTASGGTLTFTDANVLTMSGTFDLGSGGISSAVNRTISASTGAKGVIAGNITDNSGLGCGLIKSGSGTVLLSGANTYTGTTTVNAGTLGGTGTIAGPVVVNASGSLAPGASIGALTINNDLTVSGNLAIEVNKSVSPANDVVQVSGTLSGATGGKVTVANLGPALNTGDRFVLFPGKTMTGGSALTVSGAGMIWANKLEVDGSIEVLAAISTTPTNITYSVSSGTLNLSWPESHRGWSLQAQTNAPGVGLSTNWTTIGYQNTTSASIPIDPANGSVFYRLFYQTP